MRTYSRVLSREANRLRDHLDKRDAEHITRTKREKILQVLAWPFPPHNEIATKHIPPGSH